MHDDLSYDSEGPLAQVDHEMPSRVWNYSSMQCPREFRDQDTHQQLQNNLMAHFTEERKHHMNLELYFIFIVVCIILFGTILFGMFEW
jgi:hypothetical protein